MIKLSKNTAAARIYQDLGNGQAIQTDFVKTADGRTLQVPANKLEGTVPISRVPARCPVVKPDSVNSQMQNSMNIQGNPAIVTTEDATGNLLLSRAETGRLNGATKVISFSISNTEATGGPDSILVGDGNGMLALAATYGGLGITSLRAGIIFDGNWGTATGTQLKQMTSNNALDLHKLHLIGYDTSGNPDPSVFTGGFLKMARATWNGDAAQSVDVPLQMLIKPNTYQDHIREMDGFRFTLDSMSALVFKLAIGKRIDVTMEISAAAHTYLMNKVTATTR